MPLKKTRKRILLVDDSDTALMLGRTILMRGNYDVITAKDGKEGVANAAVCKPDLILMDVLMPGLDGFQAVKKLRKKRATKSIPVLMVTTKGEEESLEAGYSNGCSDYVTKPIDSHELLVKIRNFLGE